MCLSVGSGGAASGKYPLDSVVLQKWDELIWEGSFLSGQQSQVKTRTMTRL